MHMYKLFQVPKKETKVKEQVEDLWTATVDADQKKVQSEKVLLEEDNAMREENSNKSINNSRNVLEGK